MYYSKFNSVLGSKIHLSESSLLPLNSAMAELNLNSKVQHFKCLATDIRPSLDVQQRITTGYKKWPKKTENSGPLLHYLWQDDSPSLRSTFCQEATF